MVETSPGAAVATGEPAGGTDATPAEVAPVLLRDEVPEPVKMDARMRTVAVLWSTVIAGATACILSAVAGALSVSTATDGVQQCSFATTADASIARGMWEVPGVSVLLFFALGCTLLFGLWPIFHAFVPGLPAILTRSQRVLINMPLFIEAFGAPAFLGGAAAAIDPIVRALDTAGCATGTLIAIKWTAIAAAALVLVQVCLLGWFTHARIMRNAHDSHMKTLTTIGGAKFIALAVVFGVVWIAITFRTTAFAVEQCGNADAVYSDLVSGGMSVFASVLIGLIALMGLLGWSSTYLYDHQEPPVYTTLVDRFSGVVMMFLLAALGWSVGASMGRIEAGRADVAWKLLCPDTSPMFNPWMIDLYISFVTLLVALMLIRLDVRAPVLTNVFSRLIVRARETVNDRDEIIPLQEPSRRPPDNTNIFIS